MSKVRGQMADEKLTACSPLRLPKNSGRYPACDKLRRVAAKALEP